MEKCKKCGKSLKQLMNVFKNIVFLTLLSSAIIFAFADPMKSLAIIAVCSLIALMDTKKG